MSRTLTFEPKTFKIGNLDVKPITQDIMENQIAKKFTQAMSPINYKFKTGMAKCCFKTGEIELKSNPIIPYNDTTATAFKFTSSNDWSRAKLNIPLDNEQNSCSELKQMFTEIDNFIMTNEKKLIPECCYNLKGKSNSLPVHTTCIKEWIEPDNRDSNKKIFKGYDSLKMKLINDFSTKAILTKLFVKETDGKITQINVESLDDIERYVKYGATIKILGEVSNFWHMPKASTKYFGVTVKCQQIFVTKITQTKERVPEENLLESDDEKSLSDEKKSKETTSSKKINKNNSKKKKDFVEDIIKEDDEDIEEDIEEEIEEEIDEDESIETKPKKKSNNKKSKN